MGSFFLRKLAIYNTKKNLRISPFHNANLAVTWNEDTLSILNDTGFQRYEWPKFRMWTQDDLIFTLFFGPHLFLPLPKRAFTERQQENLTAQLNRANIPLATLMPF
ncbi:YcxB family protein [Agrobacterium larrymoorei]|uniref:YcxB family protein n=1 Tax=Agrobacterium larrymoorei TaxID=160699 RepID=A0A4D7DQS6_9HYPH|nr:YcxB family protein [Agrobacterium larrymoorei]